MCGNAFIHKLDRSHHWYIIFFQIIIFIPFFALPGSENTYIEEGEKNRAKASPWGAVLRFYAWGLATQRGLFTLNTPQGYSADRWASFLSLITSLKRWLTLRTHKRQHSFILEFFCCCCLRRRAGGKRLETVHLKGKHFYFFGEWILWPGVSFSSSSSSSSSEPVFNARCSKRRGCLCENASVQGGTICKIKECLWAVQGQKQK